MLAGVASAVGCSSLSSKHAVEYPGDWPVKQLTLPIDSQMEPLPKFTQQGAGTKWVDGKVLNAGLSNSCRMWILAFRSKLGWEDINDFFKRQLIALGYVLIWRMTDTEIDGKPSMMYLSTLYFNSDCTQVICLESDSGVYTLKITVYDTRQDDLMGRLPKYNH
jgi:hypothetical protein